MAAATKVETLGSIQKQLLEHCFAVIQTMHVILPVLSPHLPKETKDSIEQLYKKLDNEYSDDITFDYFSKSTAEDAIYLIVQVSEAFAETELPPDLKSEVTITLDAFEAKATKILTLLEQYNTLTSSAATPASTAAAPASAAASAAAAAASAAAAAAAPASAAAAAAAAAAAPAAAAAAPAAAAAASPSASAATAAATAAPAVAAVDAVIHIVYDVMYSISDTIYLNPSIADQVTVKKIIGSRQGVLQTKLNEFRSKPFNVYAFRDMLVTAIQFIGFVSQLIVDAGTNRALIDNYNVIHMSLATLMPITDIGQIVTSAASEGSKIVSDSVSAIKRILSAAPAVPTTVVRTSTASTPINIVKQQLQLIYGSDRWAAANSLVFKWNDKTPSKTIISFLQLLAKHHPAKRDALEKLIMYVGANIKFGGKRRKTQKCRKMSQKHRRSTKKHRKH